MYESDLILYENNDLHKCHVDFVNIWSFFSVNFDTNKVFIKKFSNIFIFKRFSFHHMTPVTSRVAYRQKYRLVFSLGFL